MLLKRFFMTLALMAAAPVLAGKGSDSPKAPAAAGGACPAPAEGQSAGKSEAEWKAYIHKLITDSEKEAPEPVDPDPFAFSVYQGKRPEPMGSQTIINGAQMEIASLIVPDPPQVVAKAYYEVFEHMGFRPLTGEIPNTRGVTYLSFRPTGSKKLKTVTLVPRGEGTVILASVGNPEDLLVKAPELPGGMPVPPNSEASATIQQDEQGSSARTASFVVKDSTPERVHAFYRQELAQRGFSPVPNGAQQGTETFEKDGVMLSISASASANSTDTSVNIVWLQ